MRDERSACHYGVSVPPRYKAVPFRGRYAPRKCLTAPFATRNLEQAIWSQIWSRLYTEYRTHTHGYTRTRGARRRSHRTHARAATGHTAIGQAPDSRAPQRRASTSHASAASVKRHTAQTQAQLCTPLSPCPPRAHQTPRAQTSRLTRHCCPLCLSTQAKDTPVELPRQCTHRPRPYRRQFTATQLHGRQRERCAQWPQVQPPGAKHTSKRSRSARGRRPAPQYRRDTPSERQLASDDGWPNTAAVFTPGGGVSTAP